VVGVCVKVFVGVIVLVGVSVGVRVTLGVGVLLGVTVGVGFTPYDKTALAFPLNIKFPLLNNIDIYQKYLVSFLHI